MTPWLAVAAEAGTLWNGAKKVGFRNALIGVLVIFLMGLVWTNLNGDLRAEAAVKNEVVPILQDQERRLQSLEQKAQEAERLLKMLANFGAAGCINGSELADRPRSTCMSIAGGATPYVK